MKEASLHQASSGHVVHRAKATVSPQLTPSRRRALMARLSLNQMTTPRWSLEQDLERYAEAGLPAIGLNWQKFDDDALAVGVELVRRSLLNVSSLGWCGGFTGAGGQSYREAMLDARRKLRVARQLQAAALVVIPGIQFNHIRSHASRLAIDAVKELCDAAADSRIDIALQPMHSLFRKNWSFLNRIDETLAILDKVNCSRAKFCFGTYHLWKEPRILEMAPEIVDRIALVQLSDWREPPRSENDRLMPGDGEIPLVDMISTLEAAGYQGTYEIEVWSRELWKLEHDDLLQSCLDRSARLLACCIPEPDDTSPSARR